MSRTEGVTSDGTTKQIKASQDAELVTRAINEAEIEHASGTGLAFSWDSGERDIDAGDTMLFVKNTSDRLLVLDRCIIVGSNVNCQWDIGLGQATTTPTGTTVTATNLNEEYTSKTFDYVASYDEGAVADASVALRVKTLANDSKEVSLQGLILGKNHYIQFNQETESTSGSVILFGHFEVEVV